MKKPIRLVGLALCSLSITVAGDALATPAEEASRYSEEQITGKDGGEKECHLFFVKNDLSLKEASLEAGDPVNTLHLFVTDTNGKIVKNAQVVTNIIDRHGNQQLTRALSFKGGYLLDIAHLASGSYLVETEILAKGRFLGDIFRFNKA